MSSEFVGTKTLLVDVQENGIIRENNTGMIIGRLVDGAPYETLSSGVEVELVLEHFDEMTIRERLLLLTKARGLPVRIKMSSLSYSQFRKQCTEQELVPMPQREFEKTSVIGKWCGLPIEVEEGNEHLSVVWDEKKEVEE